MATRTDDDRRDLDLRDEPPPPPPDDRPAEATMVTTEATEEDSGKPTRLLDTLRFLMAGALLAVLAIFAAANDTSVEIDFLVGAESVDLVWPLAAMAAGGALLMLLLHPRR